VKTGQEAAAAADADRFDAVLSDVYMPDGSGLDLVAHLRSTDQQIPIVLMTAQGSLDAAVEAVSKGASDFIAKPFEIADIVAVLRRFPNARREAQSEERGGAIESQLTKSGLVGRSAPMLMVYKLIAQAARTDATVLITGESGTGKELVARSIHDYSSRATRPFLSVNCSGLTDTLLEAELFGHTRGAFTGAATDRPGLFEATDGGTLFLDELASTSAAFQASLLRVLQSGEVRRVGSTQTRKVNVRVIGASNAPLKQLVEAGQFRADLYYRLTVLSIELPPLRTRQGDVPLLVSHFLRSLAEQGSPALHLSQDAKEALYGYPYPGNVRELENALRRAIALSSNGTITLDCLPSEIAGADRADRALTAAQRMIADRPTMDELQRRYLEFVLDETGWNRRRAAAVLELDRRTIQRLIARYKLNGKADEEHDPEDVNETENA
jgi:DNA-binding NtrC family response regulator